MNSIQSLSRGTERTAALPIIETDVPARLDRPPWARFHSLVVAALGITFRSSTGSRSPWPDRSLRP